MAIEFRDVVKKYAGTDEALGVPAGTVGGIPVVTPDDLGPAAAMTPAEVVTDEDAQAALSATFAPLAAGIEGTGMPTGVVTAPVGTVYRDLAATNGAVVWAKAAGTGNTGWRVMWGDTGWRNITPSPLPSSIASGEIHIRRRNNDVLFRLRQIMWNAHTAPLNIFPAGLAIGAGFGQVDADQRPLMSIADADLVAQDWLMPYTPSSGTVLALRMLYRESATGNTGTIPASTKHSSGICVWPTDAAWPASLPGTAA